MADQSQTQDTLKAASSAASETVLPNDKMDVASTNQKMTPITTKKWPSAAPPEGDQIFLTISCGNSHIHWATHETSPEFPPCLFWRTPHIEQSDLNEHSPVILLSRMLPEDIHEYIFGKRSESGDVITQDRAQDQSQRRAVEDIHVYIVSSNADQLNKLQTIFASVPSKVVALDGDDFFKKDQGRYEGMGTDRLATLTGAVYHYGHPALVFDGGTATTYAATNSEGVVMGGGIGPGILLKLQSMFNETDALPNITAEEVKQRVNEAMISGDPMATFAKSTKEAMIVDVFQDFAGKGRSVIARWLELAFPDDESKVSSIVGGKYNKKRVVVCTGGDGDIFHDLLRTGHGGVIESSYDNDLEYEVELQKHLIHYGIAVVLYMHVCVRRNTTTLDGSSDSYIGKRVAKVFDVESDDGDNVFRGTVVEESVLDGSKIHRVLYDDGDDEEVETDKLLPMLKLFEDVGEKKKARVKPQQPRPIPQAPRFPMKAAPKMQANGNGKNGKAPAAKKAKTNNYDDDIKHMVRFQPESFVKKRVAKDFDGECYFGVIIKYDDSDSPPMWHVLYDDGDEEDFYDRDLIKALRYYKKNEKDDKGKKDEVVCLDLVSSD